MIGETEGHSDNATPIPKLGFGTWKLTGDRCVSAVTCALDVGYRHIDTAQLYNNEADIGRALRNTSVGRDEIFLTTKVWRSSMAAGALRNSAEESLRNLATDYVDLLMIHWPNSDVPLEESLESMARLRESGKVRMLGVCNFPPTLLRRALALADLSNIQVEYHPYLAQHDLLQIVRQEGLTLTAYTPLAQGLVFRDRTLEAIGERHGKTPGQVALRWLVQQESVVAIPKSSREEHIRANYDIWDFALSEDEMHEIDSLSRGRRLVNPGFAADWERSDEALWLGDRMIPSALAPLVRAGKRLQKKLRKTIRKNTR